MATTGQYEKLVVDKWFAKNEVTLGFSWRAVTSSVEDNTTHIAWHVYIKLGSNISSFTFNNASIAVTIDGTLETKHFNGAAINTTAGAAIDLFTGTTTIKHGTDGKKKFSFSVVVDDSSFTWSLSSNGELNDIPRPSSITSAVDFNDEQNPTITYSHVNGEAYGSLQACISFTGATDDVPYRDISKTGTSYTFELTDAERETLRKGITTGSSKTVRFYIKNTINGYSKYTYITKTLTLINYTPTINPIAWDVNEETVNLTGDKYKFIKHYSNAYIFLGIATKKYATIAQYTVANGSQSFIFTDSNGYTTINGMDGDLFATSITDSRGHTAKANYDVSSKLVPYFHVTCNQVTKLNLDGTIDLSIEGKYFNDTFGAVHNELIIETRRKEDGGEWSEWAAITPLISDISNGGYTLQATISGYDPSGSYTFQSRARDKLSVAESAEDTITLKPIFDWGRYDFNFNVPLTIEGNSLNDFVIDSGTEAMGSNGTWYWRKWKSGRAECYGCRNYGNMAVSTAWGNLFRSETFTQTLPSGLFNQAPEVIDISFRSTGNYGGWIVRHEASAPSSTSSGSFIVVRPASATLTQAYIGFNIIGRW